MKIRAYKESDKVLLEEMVNEDIEGKECLGELGHFNWTFKLGYYDSVFVVEDNDKKIIGFIQVQCSTTSRTVQVAELYVKKENRGNGVSRELIERAKECGRVFDVNIMTLNVYDFNQNAIEAYEHMGFSKCGIKKYHLWYRGKHIDNIQMALTF